MQNSQIYKKFIEKFNDFVVIGIDVSKKPIVEYRAIRYILGKQYGM